KKHFRRVSMRYILIDLSTLFSFKFFEKSKTAEKVAKKEELKPISVPTQTRMESYDRPSYNNRDTDYIEPSEYSRYYYFR
ncbi:MAG: hypothetical protein L6Q33_07620, partial [Bacteriovoracaceae bacterium]|nr:hypothetical protein [Bacteriovoracaceae bacterium]